MKKRILSLILATGLIVSGCSSNTTVDSSQGKKDASNSKDAVINVAVGSFAAAAVTQFKDEWEKKTGAKVNVIEIPFGSLYEKLFTSFATGTGSYDLIIYPSNWLSEFVKGGYIKELEPYMTQKNNWDGITSTYAHMQYFDDKRYAIPLDGDSIICYYRKDVLENPEYQKKFQEKYGYPLAPPKTWSEFKDIAKFFNGWDWAKDGKTHYGALLGMAPHNVGPYLFIAEAAAFNANPNAKGYMFFDPNTMEPEINNPGYVKALETWVELKKYGPPNMINYGGGEVRANFPAGQAVLTIDWSDTAMFAQDPQKSVIKEKVGYTLLPGSKEIYNAKTDQWDKFDQPQKTSYLGYSGWTSSITSTSKNPDLAFDFMNFLDTDENALQAVMDPNTARNPYRESQLNDLKAWENGPIKFHEPKRFLDVHKESLTQSNAQYDLRIPKAGSYFDALDLGIQRALAGELTPQQALDEVAEKWKSLNQENGIEEQKKFYLNTYNLK